ncbi:MULTISPECIES: DUF4136 domain-containing protein [unclassified Flavobacterium]|uniref:DUF4136 domain-containing protein n=1 Tax=unclassified Flavobacterium TaxID=196869 RepID=UPI001F130956|nr:MULTISPECIES: DUF4136 domain-containing protein [unclassified Flavobacterium]UMY66942.1 DUF4136 domain-containing protein [Flavobacterium sp. HJ-32-4]
MKKIAAVCIAAFALVSCTSVRVASDYDKSVDYSGYKTFGFYKQGVDKVEISDLDKKRILKAIEEGLIAKGFTKSDKPDVLVNIFTKSREQINVNNFNAGWGWGWGWGWSPFWGNQTTVSSSTEGTLFIDLIDAKKRELVWQGEGTGELTKNAEKKDEKIREFVAKILEQYPPGAKK